MSSKPERRHKAAMQVRSPDYARRLTGLRYLEQSAGGDRTHRQEWLNHVCGQLQAGQPAQWRLLMHRMLTQHLRPAKGGFWPDLDLNLDRTVLHDLDLSDCQVNRANFTRTTFAGDARFDRTTFTGAVRFENTIFTRHALFRGTTFGLHALFHGAIFTGNAMFQDAEIAGEARFFHARISGRADFSGAVFGDDAAFDDVYFGGRALFGNARFATKARFDDAVFHGRAIFSDTSRVMTNAVKFRWPG
ncbi:MAG: pentapeptide repeat-containing protein [Kibdelosporangium sp.]